MKKNTFLFVILLSTLFCFGQTTLTIPCYNGLSFTVKNDGWHKDHNAYDWWIKVKNTYTKRVSFRYYLLVGNESENVNPNGGTVVLNLEPGQTWSNDYGPLKALLKHSDSNNFKVIVSEVCFAGANCYQNGYFDCNGKQTIKGNSKSGNISQQYTNENNTKGNTYTYSNNPNTQNDLDEYNRSKAKPIAANTTTSIVGKWKFIERTIHWISDNTKCTDYDSPNKPKPECPTETSYTEFRANNTVNYVTYWAGCKKTESGADGPPYKIIKNKLQLHGNGGTIYEIITLDETTLITKLLHEPDPKLYTIYTYKRIE